MEARHPEWTLADRLRKAREAAGLSQQEVAEFIVRGRSTVVNYENGHTAPSQRVLSAWAQKCDVALEWLRGDNGGPGLPDPASRWMPRSLVSA